MPLNRGRSPVSTSLLGSIHRVLELVDLGHVRHIESFGQPRQHGFWHRGRPGTVSPEQLLPGRLHVHEPHSDVVVCQQADELPRIARMVFVAFQTKGWACRR